MSYFFHFSSLYSRLRNKRTGTLINFKLFSSGYVQIKGGTFINFLIFYLLNIFLTFFPSPMYKKIKWSVIFKRGLYLFKGLCLLFLLDVPGATLIKGGTFIPESRVFNSLCLTFSDHSLLLEPNSGWFCPWFSQEKD